VVILSLVVGRREASYTISASLTSSMPRLIDGVPSSGAVALHGWVYYTFHNTFGTKRDLHVTLTSATGNADLYVTLGTSRRLCDVVTHLIFRVILPAAEAILVRKCLCVV
jgi:hypothetical protein